MSDKKDAPKDGEGINQSVKEAIAMATGVAVKTALETIQGQRGGNVPAPVVNRNRCQVCRQLETACNGKHRRVYVGPQNPSAKYAKFFAGIRLNGVDYCSSHPGHLIDIPADSNIENMVQTWEQQEIEWNEGKIAQHHSGGLGPGTPGFNPATRGWR